MTIAEERIAAALVHLDEVNAQWAGLGLARQVLPRLRAILVGEGPDPTDDLIAAIGRRDAAGLAWSAETVSAGLSVIAETIGRISKDVGAGTHDSADAQSLIVAAHSLAGAAALLQDHVPAPVQAPVRTAETIAAPHTVRGAYAPYLPTGLTLLTFSAIGGGLWAAIRAGCGYRLVTTPEPVPDEAAAEAWARQAVIPPACAHSTPGLKCWRAEAGVPLPSEGDTRAK